MIADLVPPAVRVVETTGELPEERLYPEEEAVVARAVPKRRREFTTGRGCARAALARLGLPRAPIPPGERGAPCWPPGIVGSITHCAGYRGAAVARAGEIAAIGVDAELHDVLPAGVLGLVATGTERTHLAELARRQPGVHWDRLLFSAKESVYKAWFPLTRRWLDFDQAELRFDPLAATFTARLRAAGMAVGGAPVTALAGRWSVRDGLALTAIVVPAPRADPGLSR